MRWFNGSIVEAVAAAQAKNSLFCVVILGTDGVSQELETSLESMEVQQVITTEEVVCIRITSESEELQHFARIYTDAKSPSIYCITNQGVPVEIISTTLDSVALKIRLQSAVTRHNEVISSASKAKLAPPSQPTGTTGVEASASSSTDASIPLENRIERAKQLALAKQQKKAEEEADEEKKREIERRQVGQKVAELKRWQAEQEMKKLAEERRKDKEQEAQLRRRLKDQIAQDRIDQQARSDMTSGVTSTSTEKATTSSSVPALGSKVQPSCSGQARLQFRLPDGSSQNHSFDPDATLGQVRQYLSTVIPYRDFTIWVAFPRRQFTTTDNGTSLRELGLLPSSALLIIPVTGTSIVQNAGQAGHGVLTFLTAFFGYMIYPITFILTLLQKALPTPASSTSQNQNKHNSDNKLNTTDPRNRPNRSNTLDDKNTNSPVSSTSYSTNIKKPETGPSTSSESRSKGTTGTQGKKTTEKGTTEGNVHRLRTSESDSDDEQATWNGNSTQQM